jgi:hypothetical protein
MTFLLLASTGLATRALARQALPEAPATLAGCAALFSPYALFNAYGRTAFGELAGGFWIPLLLLFALRDRNPSAQVWRRALDGSTLPLALVVAGCWLSDAPVGVMACYLLAAVALASALLARAWFPVARAFIAVSTGIALAALYLIPAAWEQRWVDILQATGVNGDPGLNIENNWLFPHHTLPVLHQRDLALHMISPIAVFMIAVALVSLLALRLLGRLSTRGDRAAPFPTENAAAAVPSLPLRWWLPLGLIFPAVFFLLLPVSLPVWNLLPKLRFLQFPWRWLLAVEAPMAILFAAAVWPGQARRRWLRPAAALICALFFLATTFIAVKNLFQDDVEIGDLAALLQRYESGAGFVGTDEYTPPGADNSLVATGLPDACLTAEPNIELGIAPTLDANPDWRPNQGSCIVTASASLRQPERIHITTVATRAGFLVLRLRSYPAWRVLLNGRLATGLPARLDGLVAVPVPQGPVDLTVEWTTTPDVIAGRCVSLLALLGLIFVGLLERRFSASRLSRFSSGSV